jgi:hypothetical protein
MLPIRSRNHRPLRPKRGVRGPGVARQPDLLTVRDHPKPTFANTRGCEGSIAPLIGLGNDKPPSPLAKRPLEAGGRVRRAAPFRRRLLSLQHPLVRAWAAPRDWATNDRMSASICLDTALPISSFCSFWNLCSAREISAAILTQGANPPNSALVPAKHDAGVYRLHSLT